MSSGFGRLALITGASGFIGNRLLSVLEADGVPSRTLSRMWRDSKNVVVGDLQDAASLGLACETVDTVFHCAGYAHAFSALNQDEVIRHQLINFEGTRNLVNAAGQTGVRRFVFLSSVKAMAEPHDVCADEDWPGLPQTDYGRAKRAAEEAVLEAGVRYGMHVVNLRLAMVYGAGGRGNLERMGRLIRLGIFPPLPETGNHRSLVHVNDVVSAIRLVVSDSRAAGQTYIVANEFAPSGRQLYEAIRGVSGLPHRGGAVPRFWLQGLARVGDGLGRVSGRRMPFDSEVLQRLLGSAWYSPARIRRDLGWGAQISLEDGLSEMMSGGLSL